MTTHGTLLLTPLAPEAWNTGTLTHLSRWAGTSSGHVIANLIGATFANAFAIMTVCTLLTSYVTQHTLPSLFAIAFIFKPITPRFSLTVSTTITTFYSKLSPWTVVVRHFGDGFVGGFVVSVFEFSLSSIFCIVTFVI